MRFQTGESRHVSSTILSEIRTSEYLESFFSKLGARLAVFVGGASSKARLSESGLIGSICAGHTKFVLFFASTIIMMSTLNKFATVRC